MIPSPKPTPAVIVPEFRDFIRRLPCILGNESPCVCAGYFDPVRRVIVSEFAHARTKRNNGDVENGLPLCAKHHKEQHRVGIKSFAARHSEGLLGRTLREAAVDYWADFLTQGGTP